MITEDQRKERVGYLGGSDSAAAMGLSRWGTPLSVWAEKTGQILRRDLDSEAVELGRELEDYVARRFTKKTGKELHRVNETLFHPKYPFLAANIDRRVVGEKAIFEAKVTGAFKAREWEQDQVPMEYLIQCQHYLAVTGAERAYIACLVGNRDFVWKTIERDDRALADLVEREVSFWNDFVVTKVMPMTFKAWDKGTLGDLFPEAAEGKTVELEGTAAATCEVLEGMEEDLKALERQIDEQKNTLRAMMGDADTGTVGPWKVRWQNVKTRRLDMDALKKGAPDIFEQYRKETLSRKFLISKVEAANG